MNRRDTIKALLSIPALATNVSAKASGKIEKFRPCDGACCHDSPLRRGSNGTGCQFCVFHDHSMQFDVNSGCRIMADRQLLNILSEDELGRFAEACLGYPQIYPSDTMGEKDSSICCWRNV